MLIPPILNVDGYKFHHVYMMPEGMTKLYSNMTPRSYKRLRHVKHSIFFGLQYYIKEYLITQWNDLFFNQPMEKVINQYKRFHKSYSGCDIDTTHIEKLHNLGYLPIKIKALQEGALVPERVPYLTIVNTHNDHAWLVNFLETQMNNCLWKFCAVATIAREFKILTKKYMDETSSNNDFLQWSQHDFSQRGLDSTESTFCQAGHLLSFTGTDTCPSILFLEEYYNANMENELIGASVPASEHMIASSYENEIDGFSRILDIYPNGIVSLVSDTYNLWRVCTEFMDKLHDKIMSRNGKTVLRPDSGSPKDIICGTKNFGEGVTPQEKGIIELLWERFGGTINSKGYKELDPHIGVIQGDGTTYDRVQEIFEGLKNKGFATNNIVFGVGSYTYNGKFLDSVLSRDIIGLATKGTYCEINNTPREIFKDPITDNGTKKSLKGLLYIGEKDGELFVEDQVSPEKEQEGLLTEVFVDGRIVRETSLSEIRNRLCQN